MPALLLAGRTLSLLPSPTLPSLQQVSRHPNSLTAAGVKGRV
jgi:hypothetical protein